MYTSDMKNLGSRWTGPNIPLRTAAARSLLVVAIISPKRLYGRPKHNIKSYYSKSDERCSTDNNNNNNNNNIVIINNTNNNNNSSNEKHKEKKQAVKARSRRSISINSKNNSNSDNSINNNYRKNVVQQLHLSVRSYKTSLYVTTTKAIATATVIKKHFTKKLRKHQPHKKIINIVESIPLCLALRQLRHQQLNYRSSPKTPSRHFRKC